MFSIFDKAGIPAPVIKQGLTNEELEFQQDLFEALRYQTFVLEFIAHKLAPGNLEFQEFQKQLKHASSK